MQLPSNSKVEELREITHRREAIKHDRFSSLLTAGPRNGNDSAHARELAVAGVPRAPCPHKAGITVRIQTLTRVIRNLKPRGPIYTTTTELSPQNHSRNGLLGPKSIMVVYMDPLRKP